MENNFKTVTLNCTNRFFKSRNVIGSPVIQSSTAFSISTSYLVAIRRRISAELDILKNKNLNIIVQKHKTDFLLSCVHILHKLHSTNNGVKYWQIKNTVATI